MSKLDYELFDMGVRFHIHESTSQGIRDNYRTDVVEWSKVTQLSPFPEKEPQGYFRTEAFWMAPVGAWVAYVFASYWEGGGGNEDEIGGPFGFSQPPPTVVEIHQANLARRLVHWKIKEFRYPQKPYSLALKSVFISYGSPDLLFATKLNEGLLRAGVSTFFFPNDALPGAKLHTVMRDGVNQYDHVVLVCSRGSLDRPGVTNEVEETLQREAREGGKSILIPIAIDDYVFSEWAPSSRGVAQSVRDRVVADFRDAVNDPMAFDRALDRVVGVLSITEER